MTTPARTTPDACLEQFGLTAFRPGQRQVIDAILAGQDTLCVMPTGGGKSLCYQLPTLMREGVTIVVSPLIALMKDQVDALLQRGIPATLINSTLTASEQRERVEAMSRGEFRLVYIAPERLRSVSFMKGVQAAKVQMLAVDEAHCISHWGHDFRPDYARLGRFRQLLGFPQTVALTATATELVREDIGKVLELNEPQTFVTGFARDNLFLRVETPNSGTEKDRRLIEFLREHPGSGIVYASTRKACEQLMTLLSESLDRPAGCYHAGMPTDQRRQVQEQFMSGELPIIVATNAFGMGIDKPDLRFVVHYNIPGSIEAYYQEAGRAGRDGLPSECLLLYSFQDKFIQEFFIENSYPSRETIRDVYEFLRAQRRDPVEMSLQELRDELDLSLGTSGIGNCENLLERAGALERMDSQDNMAAIRLDSDLPTLVDLLPREADAQRAVLRGLERLVGPLRGERVLFRPQAFADQLGMKWGAVSRALRVLTKLDQVDYVPPFRGRAIHLLCPEKPFEQLDIDFPELERRKKFELEKLQRMIALATTRRCRQLEILEYFGDPERARCGNCDNCQARPDNSTASNATEREVDACLYASQVALSGVVKTGERYGKTLIAQMLVGSDSQKLDRFRLRQQSTFGLLSPARQKSVVQLLDVLIEQGFLLQTDSAKFRPVVKISRRGKELMTGRALPPLADLFPPNLVRELGRVLRGRRPHRPSEPANSGSERDAIDGQAPGSPPEIRVEAPTPVHDASVNKHPVHEPSVNKGPEAAIEHPMPAATEAAGHDSSPPSQSPGPAKQEGVPESDTLPRERLDSPHSPSSRPDFFWTWHLFDRGFALDEVTLIRRLPGETIEEHLVRAAENGWAVSPEWLLTGAELRSLERIVRDHPEQRDEELLARVPNGIPPRRAMVFLRAAGARK